MKDQLTVTIANHKQEAKISASSHAAPAPATAILVDHSVVHIYYQPIVLI
jgi:hypothetical protein